MSKINFNWLIISVNKHEIVTSVFGGFQSGSSPFSSSSSDLEIRSPPIELT